MKKVTKADLEQREADAYRQRMDALVVSRFQAKVALDEIGILDEVQTYMEGEEVSRFAKLAWEEGGFKRGSNLINTIGAEFGFNTEQLDEIFLKARSIRG